MQTNGNRSKASRNPMSEMSQQRLLGVMPRGEMERGATRSSSDTPASGTMPRGSMNQHSTAAGMPTGSMSSAPAAPGMPSGAMRASGGTSGTARAGMPQPETTAKPCCGHAESESAAPANGKRDSGEGNGWA